MATGVKTIRFRFTITLRPGEGTNAVWKRLNRFAESPALLIPILRAAMEDTLLKAYEERFESREREMAGMRRLPYAKGATILDRKKLDSFQDLDKLYKTREQEEGMSEAALARQRRAQLRQQEELFGERSLHEGIAAQEISNADLTPAQRREEAMLSISNLKGQILMDLGRGSTSAWKLPDGEKPFRAVMEDVLDLLVSASKIKVHKSGGKVTLGIGKISELDKVQTPHTEVARTTQPFGIMWRQLEFGTGVFAKRGTSAYGGFRAGSGSTTKDPTVSGAWWLGPHKPAGEPHSWGLRLLGSDSGNFLRTRTGIPYTTDGIKFSGDFQAKLSAALRAS